MSNRVVVIGAGAAGMMAAIFAATSGAQTTLIERTKDGGRKILISGGGRCNILPAKLDESRYFTDSSRKTIAKILRSWPLDEQIRFFEEELGLELEEEVESSKLFPSTHRARDVRDGLIELARRRGVKLVMNTKVVDVRPVANGRWAITTEGEKEGILEADKVIIATGGLSVPNTGSDGIGLNIVKRLGHEMHVNYAALAPIVASNGPFAELSGVSLNAELTAISKERSASAEGGFLFTHNGYSGPSVLNISHVVARAPRGSDSPADVRVNWGGITKDFWESLFTASGTRTVLTVVRTLLPERLAISLVEKSGVDPMTRLPELKRADRLKLISTLTEFPLPWTSDDGYKKAEVTGGGVSLSAINPKTMESRVHPNLYMCGEILDAFGPIGGFNFFWAWATGRAAGKAAAVTN